jgi:hypothetical protein
MSVFKKVLSAFGKTPAPGKSKIVVQQSDWTRIGEGFAKRWGISGLIDSSEEFVVRLEVYFSTSSLFGDIEPHIFIFLHPNQFGQLDGFATILLSRLDAVANSSFCTAKLDSTSNGEISLVPLERENTFKMYETLSNMQPFVVHILGKSETMFQLTLPNSTNNFLKIANEVIADYKRNSK